MGEGWKCIARNASNSSECWINKIPDYIDGLEIYKKSFLKDDLYWIIDSFKETVFEYNLNELIN